MIIFTLFFDKTWVRDPSCEMKNNNIFANNNPECDLEYC